MAVPMKDKQKILRYKGIFDWNAFYKNMVGFFGKRKYDWWEKKYDDKMKASGKELECIWEATRELNEHILNVHNIYMKINDFSYVDIIDKDGNKKRMVKGRINLILNSSLLLDYDNRWETTPVKKKLMEFYHEFVIKKDIQEVYMERLRKESDAFMQEMKKTLEYESISRGYDYRLNE